MEPNPSSNLGDERENLEAIPPEILDYLDSMDEDDYSDDYDDDDDDDDDINEDSYDEYGDEVSEDEDDDLDDEEDDEEEEEDEANAMEIGGGAGELKRGESGELGKNQGGAPPVDPADSPDCPICYHAWNSDGAHRVCCIPCGHVYGRSCLEKWLQQRKKTIGKCPQCNQKFKLKEIVNLYAPLVVIPNDDLEKELRSLREENESLKLKRIVTTRKNKELRLTAKSMEKLIEMMSEQNSLLKEHNALLNKSTVRFLKRVAVHLGMPLPDIPFFQDDQDDASTSGQNTGHEQQLATGSGTGEIIKKEQ